MVWQCGCTCNGKNLKCKDTLMLMQRIHLNQELDRAANCEQVGWSSSCLMTKRQFHQNLFWAQIWYTSYSKKSLPWKQILSSQRIPEIFAIDPSKPWSRSLIFDSTVTKQIYETRDTIFAKDFEGVTCTYRLQAKDAH